MASRIALVLTTLYLLAVVAFGAESNSGEFRYYGDSNDSGLRPHEWGGNPQWRLCKVGKEQSPINIDTKIATLVIDVFGMDTSYVPANGSLFIDTANILEVELNGGGKFKIGQTTYYLQQFHFHSPSEHTIDGVRFPLELHLVHKSDTGDLAVIGFLFSYGEENAFLATFWDEIPLLTSSDVAINLTNVDVSEPNLHMGPAYARYRGSLTTPPCSENVTWTVVLGEVNTVSQRQMWTYSKRLPYSNARPVQKLYDRKVEKRVSLMKRR